MHTEAETKYKHLRTFQVLYFSKAHEVTRGILPVKDEEFRQKRQ
jgi:hypothetical protein